jgi:hypothetical protein
VFPLLLRATIQGHVLLVDDGWADNAVSQVLGSVNATIIQWCGMRCAGVLVGTDGMV